jgi:hypothetical protein
MFILSRIGRCRDDATGLDGFWGWTPRAALPLAAVLMSRGFFAAMAGKGRSEPNRAIAVLYAGAVSLAAGTLTLGIGLLAA